MSDVEPKPETLAAMHELAVDVERLATTMQATVERWRLVAAHMRGGALVAALTDQRAANRDADQGSLMATELGVKMRKLFELDRAFCEHAMRQVAIADMRAHVLLVTDVEMLRTSIEQHIAACSEPDCFMLPLLQERLAYLAPH